MNSLQIVEPGGKPVRYTKEEAHNLWNRGAISSAAYYWTEDMTEWRPVSELFPKALGEAQITDLPVRGATATGPSFAKDSSALTSFLQVMLWLSLASTGASVIAASISIATGNAAKANDSEFTLVDAYEGLPSLVQALVFVITGIAFLRWIHLANRNARHLGAQHLLFTPGWSIGFYFIPILNLWKPYQAMKEIWQASHNPVSWRTEPVPSLLANWWGLWLLTNFLGQMNFRLSMRAQSSAMLKSASVTGLLSDLSHIALCVVSVRLITSIYNKQAERAAGLAPSQA